MSCYQLTVSGSGSANPSGVKFPGAYSATDPGILINIHYPLPTSYTIPGPSVYTGGGSSGSAPSSSQSQSHTQTSTTRTSTSTSTVSSTITSSSSSSTSTGTAAQYAQCGGNGYTGPTTCASPYKCVAVSPPYYSQCQ
jgi:cellulase